MRCVTDHGIGERDLAVRDLLHFGVNGAHGLDETVQFRQGLGLGGLHHEGARHGERQGGGVEAEVDQSLAHVLRGDTARLGHGTQIQDALVGHQSPVTGVQGGEHVRERLGNVVGAQHCRARGLGEALGAGHGNVHPGDGQDTR